MPTQNRPLAQTPFNIVAIGANYRMDAGLGHRDRAWLSHTLRFCCDHNVTVPQDFTFTPINYANGHDFLDPRLSVKADILISCFVADADKWPKAIRESPKALRYNDEFLVSPRHSQSAWRAAAERTGAHLIVTFQRDREIGVSHFSGDVYKSTRMEEVIAPPSENGDSIYWMGPLVRADHAAEISLREKSIKKTRAAEPA
jgi:hypothetical protein